MRCPRLILRWTICSTGLHDGGKLPAGATWPNPHGTEDRSMTVTDIATRTYNHNFRLDPIVRIPVVIIQKVTGCINIMLNFSLLCYAQVFWIIILIKMSTLFKLN